MCSLTRVVLLDSSCFQTCAHTNSVIITQFWKWGVNEDKMKMKKKKSWSTIVNWPPFTPLPSPIIAYISFFLSFYFIYTHTYTYYHQISSVLSKNLQVCAYECVTMSNMYQEKTNKESVLFVADIAWCSFASHLYTIYTDEKT